MWILVNHDGQQLGPYREDEVRAALASGAVRPADLAWVENTPAWVPLGSLFSDAPPRQPPTLRPAASPYFYGQPELPTSVLAVVSFVLGIVSLVMCMTFVTGIPAILCGHAARARIERGFVKEKGEGLALAGLIMGYLATLPFVLMALFAFPVMLTILHQVQKELGPIPHESSQQKVQASLEDYHGLPSACAKFAREHGGVYPKTLEELFPGYVSDPRAFTYPPLDRPNAVGFWYFGQDLVNPEGRAELLVSRGKDAQGRRLIVRVDGSSRLEQSDRPQLER